MPFIGCLVLFAAAALGTAGAPAPAQLRRTQIAVERQLDFHSSLLLNLHHVLHAAAAERRNEPRRIRPGGLDGTMTVEERQAWEASMDYYGRELVARDLRTGEGMTAIKQALISEDLASLPRQHREALERALPIYRWYFWPAHDRENRAFTADLLAKFRDVASGAIPRLERLLGMPWPTARVRVDVVWVGKPSAYTTLDPLHVVMPSTEAQTQQWQAVEILLHELAHSVSGELEREFAAAFRQRGVREGDVSHAALFYITGEVLRLTLDIKGLRYDPYLYSTGLFDRAWPSSRPALEANLKPYVDGKVSLPEAAARIAGALQMAPPSADPPVADVARLRFYSSFWMNLHHTLYGAAWTRRPEVGTLRALAGPLPVPLDAPMQPDERAAWTAAVDYYNREIASRDLLFGRGMEALKLALVAGDLGSSAVGPELRAILERAAPIYRRHFWPAHDAVNRVWIAATADRVRSIAPEVITRLEKLYGTTWFLSPVRIDIVWVGNRQGAYATNGPPPHVTISSGDPEISGWAAAEMVFHEVSHVLVVGLQERLDAALGNQRREHGVLWHVVQFYLTGVAVQEVLRARKIAYEPYLYSTGLFDRAWPHYRKAVEEHWRPYVDGRIGLDEAISRTVAALR